MYSVILCYNIYCILYMYSGASTFQDFHLHTDYSRRNSATEPITSKNTWRLTLPKVNPKRALTRFTKCSNPPRLWNRPSPRRSMTPETKWRKHNMMIRRKRIYYRIQIIYILWSRRIRFLFFCIGSFFHCDCSLIYFYILLFVEPNVIVQIH